MLLPSRRRMLVATVTLSALVASVRAECRTDGIPTGTTICDPARAWNGHTGVRAPGNRRGLDRREQ
jgi:hypothetical protein